MGLFVHLGSPAVGLMEARNFVAAREMYEGGSWLLPTMNGALRLEKPPLPTWLVASVMHLTGNTTDLGLLRLPSALGASLLVLFFWVMGREITTDQAGHSAWLGALVLASSLLLLTVGRDGNGWDVYSYCFAAGALALALRGLRSHRPAVWFVGGGMLLGLSFLSKGPVAWYGMVLPFALAYFWQGNRLLFWRYRWQLLLIVGVGLVVGGLWPAYVLSQHLDSAAVVASTEASSWANRHVKAPWFYFNFPVFTGVWAVAALAALVWPYAASRIRRLAPYGLLLAWLGITLLALSVIPEKKERYMLPLLPPLALLVGALVRYWLSQPIQLRADKRVLYSWFGVLVLVVAGIPGGLVWAQLPGFIPGLPQFWAVAGACLLLLLLVVRFFHQQKPALAVVVGSLFLVVLGTTSLMPAYPLWDARRAEAGIRPQAQMETRLRQYHNLPAFSASPMHIKWVWAAGRRVPEWDTTALPAKPLLLYAGHRLSPADLPHAWRHSVRLTRLDSFNLGRRHAQGMWYVHLVH